MFTPEPEHVSHLKTMSEIKYTLRKHSYSNIMKISPQKKTVNFRIKKNSDIFSCFCSKHGLLYSLQPPRRGNSNEYPQSMFFEKK